MKLRRRLVTLHLSVVALLALAFGVVVAIFFLRTLPMLTQGLETKTRSCLHSVLRDADLALGANDPQLLAKAVDRCHGGDALDPDLAFVAVFDRAGQVVVARGALPADAMRPGIGPRDHVVRGTRGFRGQAQVALEGMVLGTVVAEFSTLRIERWKRGIVLFCAAALVLVLLSTAASVVFALALVKPLREMIDFVHDVARGRLERKLAVTASDELALLAEDLNSMTASLRRSRELLADTARGAGMAEVAISVLHNVGNVLNSVNTSTYLIGAKVRGSKSSTLGRIAELLEGRKAELAAFLERDERGRRLPELISALAKQLRLEQEELLQEIGRLRESVSHINTIVATQQQYASARMVEEGVDLAQVVESALQISADELSAGDVTVTRDYADVPRVATDRHKVVQILVNLLRNAREALATAEGRERQVGLRLRARGADGVAISVTDNGLGIAEQELTRIFQHGYTTKANGHGFGLHYSANAAVDLGGTLSAQSEGPGRGATFTLELPLAPKR